jgi:glutathione peroxidase
MTSRGLRIAAALAALGAAGCGRREAAAPDAGRDAMTGSRLYEFTLDDIDGRPRALADYRGQVLLLVNVASRCGYTPQYAMLEELYARYKSRGFRILAFPANNFGNQEPGTNEEIKAFCSTNYGVTFDLFSKISVRGDDIHPLYAWLTTGAGVDGPVTWNFNKFLVDRAGHVVARYASGTKPLDPELTDKIEELLAKR